MKMNETYGNKAWQKVVFRASKISCTLLHIKKIKHLNK